MHQKVTLFSPNYCFGLPLRKTNSQLIRGATLIGITHQGRSKCDGNVSAGTSFVVNCLHELGGFAIIAHLHNKSLKNAPSGLDACYAGTS